MDILRKKEKVRHWEEVIEHDDVYEVTDWHATAEFWGPRILLAFIVIFGVFITKGPLPLLLVPIYFFFVFVDMLIAKWGRWLRLIGWALLVGGLVYLINALNQFPQIPPTP